MHLTRRMRRARQILHDQGAPSLANACVAKVSTLRSLPSTVRSQPLRAQIEITNACNLRCTMCAQSVDDWRSEFARKNLSLEEFKQILHKLPYIQFALINGVGEPMLNRDLPAMIQYASSRGVQTGFFTNGTLLTPELARTLIQTDGLVCMFVSLDAGTAKSFEKIRIGATFDDVLENLRMFLQTREDLGRKKPHVAVWMVGMGDNVNEIPDLVKELRRVGVTDLRIKGILEGEKTEGERISRESFERFREYEKIAAQHDVNLSYDAHPDAIGTDTRTCTDPWETIYINASGEVNPCCYSFWDKSTYFGNIFEKSLTSIWNGDGYRNFRYELKHGMPGCCKDCPKHSVRVMGSATPFRGD